MSIAVEKIFLSHPASNIAGRNLDQDRAAADPGFRRAAGEAHGHPHGSGQRG